MTQVLVYQHMAADGPGFLGEALLRHGAALDICYLYRGDAVRDPSAYDALLVMGGEMNVYQDEQFPWLSEETHLIRQAALAGQPILGICLGGQLLARALDANVRLGGAPEIAVTELTLTAAGRTDLLFEGLPVLEAVVWHDDTFDIPSGAVRLAASAGCANQAYRFGDRAYGLQFHPEVTPAMLDDWIEAAPHIALERRRALRAEFVRRAGALQAQADCLAVNFLRRRCA